MLRNKNLTKTIYSLQREQFEQLLSAISILRSNFLMLCTCHRLALEVNLLANQGDCKMGGAKLRISPRSGGI